MIKGHVFDIFSFKAYVVSPARFAETPRMKVRNISYYLEIKKKYICIIPITPSHPELCSHRDNDFCTSMHV